MTEDVVTKDVTVRESVPTGGPVRLVDMVFPGDTNHHGTLFGGVALAHMDKVAFLVASRHGRVPFVTASCERIDFAAPALKGELVEATGRIVRVGTRSCEVEVDLIAEALLSGERRLCTRGRFTLVATAGGVALPPIPPALPEAEDGVVRMMDMVFPPQTNHYGTLFGGDALRMLGKGAFIAATRASRAVMVMAASDRIDFRAPVREGEMTEIVARVSGTGTASMQVAADLWAEDLLTGARRHAASAAFVMVAVDAAGRPRPIVPG